MAKHNDIRIESASDPRLMGCLRAAVRAYAAGLGFSAEATQEIVLAVDEACTNAIRHSYKGRSDELIVLSLQNDGECVEFEVSDAGEPAPREKVMRREIAPPDPETLMPGGLGVQLIYSVFDEVLFSPGESTGNSVIMRRRFPR